MRAVLKPLVAASLVALTMAGCSADTTPADPKAADPMSSDTKPADSGSVRGLTDLAGRHYDADYTPLASRRPI